MDFITRFSLNTSRVTIVFILTLVLLGLTQFFTFPRQEDPPIVIREIVVVTLFPGMKPAGTQAVRRRIDIRAGLGPQRVSPHQPSRLPAWHCHYQH